MTHRRFYAPPEAFAPDGTTVTLARDEARHLFDVLRLRAGDEAFVFDGAGREYLCVVAGAAKSRDAARLNVQREVASARPESPLDLTLAVALLKGEKFDLVMQKATELGVARIVPVMTKRADVRLRDEADAAKRVARWRRLAVEAAKQSGRARVPEISAPRAFDEMIQRASTDVTSLRVMFSERDGHGLEEMISALSAPRAVTALVGAEGGWEDEELERARVAAWEIVTLGGRTLRAETAAITAVVLLQHL